MAINATVDGVTYSGVDTIKTGGKVIGLTEAGALNIDAIAEKTLTEAIGSASFVGSSAFYGQSQLSIASFSNALEIFPNAFDGCKSLNSIYFPNVSMIRDNAFMSTGVVSCDFPSASFVGNGAFLFCTDLTQISLPIVSTIGRSAFQNCSNLESVELPLLSVLSDTVFYSCTKLSFVSAPQVSEIKANCFMACNSLVSIYMPSVQILRNYAFQLCGIVSVDFPSCRTLESYAFNNCSSLETVKLSALSNTTAMYTFQNCVSLKTVEMPIVDGFQQSFFYNCQALSEVSFPKARMIGANVFNRCFNLLSLTLEYYSNSVVWLVQSNAFESTPIAGYTASTGGQLGSIYVPASLLTAYQSATNWAFFSERFVGV